MTGKEERALIDQLGELDVEIAPLETKKKQAEEIRGQLRGLRPKMKPEQAFQLEGAKFVAQIGVMGDERKISDMKAVARAVGAEAFMGHCSFTLKKLEELLQSSAKVAALVTTARTGSRTVKTFLRSK